MYINTNINRHLFKTKIVNNEKDIKMGMMGKNFTKEFDALLFVMNTPTSSFWMKNCIVPLDIIFIKNNIITKIHHNCPPCNSTNNDCKKYKGNGDLVIEIPGGLSKKLNIEKGHHVTFTK